MKNKNLLILLQVMLFLTIISIRSVAQSYLDINNIKALINYEGSFFWDYQTQVARSEFPKGSGKLSIFASTLWIGGYDAGNNLHEAAQTYRQSGTDYWAGPLDVLNLSTDTAGWQKTWKINKSTIDYHRTNYTHVGYTLPPEIKNWPGNGAGNHDKVLAPFIDMNSNYSYDPADGDFPYIFGDQAVYFIMNDTFSNHQETKSRALGVEIHAMAYAFNTIVNGVSLDNTIFVRYQIKNRSNNNYHDLYAGIWTDFDIGYAFDDFIGCDSNRNMYYGYNGDNLDQGVKGYGTNPPMQAIKFLNRPMTHYIYYDNDFSLKGNPVDEIDYYFYLSGRYKNGQHLRYGGDGFNNVWDTRNANYMFPSDPRLGTPDWSEVSAGNVPGDRRGLGSIGPLNLNAGEVMVFDIAYIFINESRPNYLDVFDVLTIQADKVQQLYNLGKITNPYQAGVHDEKTQLMMTIAPNPMDEYTVISFSNPENKVFNLLITDLYGRVIYQNQTVKSEQIKLLRDEMKPGFYIVTLSDEASLGQMKLIIK